MKARLALLLAILLTASTLATAAEGPSVDLDGTLLTTDPHPVESGEDARVSFKIRNTGNSAAEDVKVEILDSYPFELKPDRKQNYSLGTVRPGESYYITTYVLVAEDSPDGENDLRIRITNDDFSRTESIPVTVQSEDIELNLANLETSPSALMPDTEDNQMTLEVVNNGEKTAENVVVELQLPDPFQETSSFSTRQSLGNVEAGEVKSAEFSFDLSENISTGMWRIPGTISYTASDNTPEIEEEVSFETFISGKPQYRIDSVSSDLRTGSSGTIEVKVTNTGSEKSESTRVRILDNSDLPFSFDSSNRFMGSLRPGDTGTVVFDVSVENDANAKEHLLDFEIRGVKDSEVFVEEKVRAVDVRDGERGQNLPLIPVAVLGVLVAGAGIFLYRRENGRFRK